MQYNLFPNSFSKIRNILALHWMFYYSKLHIHLVIETLKTLNLEIRNLQRQWLILLRIMQKCRWNKFSHCICRSILQNPIGRLSVLTVWERYMYFWTRVYWYLYAKFSRTDHLDRCYVFSIRYPNKTFPSYISIWLRDNVSGNGQNLHIARI